MNVDRLVKLLKQAQYNPTEIEFLRTGFTHDFDIGYQGPEDRKSTSDNIPLTVGNEVQLWNKLIKEVRLRRVAGPFEEIPFEDYIQSPIRLIPKSGSDQTRLIFHLSYNFTCDGKKSLNHHTPAEKCSVKYRDIDYAVQNYLDLLEEVLQAEESEQKEFQTQNEACDEELPSSARLKKHQGNRLHVNQIRKPVIYSGKSDVRSTFRILGLSRKSWKWLVMKARDPLTKIWKYFVDKCLPFGASISCALFQRFSNALCFLIEWRLQVSRRVTNYLDDFHFIALTVLRCNYMIQQFLELCEFLGVPISLEKTEWASELIIFLGILLDGTNWILAVPEEKCVVAVSLLQEISNKRTATVKLVQQLCGYLNFLCCAIVLGRAFMRRMYAKFSKVVNVNGAPRNAFEHKM